MSEYVSATTTPKQVFDIFCSLSDNAVEFNDEEEADATEYPVTDSSRHYVFDDTQDYYSRVLLIINNLAGECFRYSDTYNDYTMSTPSGRRVLCPTVMKMTDVIPLDDYISRTVLPYGLGAVLLADENPNLAAFFQDEYQRLLRGLMSGIPAETAQPIVSSYDGCYDGDGNWHGYFPYNWTTIWGC